ncbi:MAG TPA: hypothetical protein HPP77_05925 [Candidatus Hydrogenedentes bacterium]|nr:hypothetical protein [Candidatus Hydrogenedentota bacterium]
MRDVCNIVAWRKAAGCVSMLALASAALLVGGCATAPPRETFSLEVGDLLFQDLDGSPLCDAIEKVTHGFRGADVSHVGLVSRVAEDETVIIEAVSEGVRETSLDEFLGRSRDGAGRPKVFVGRLRPRYRRLAPEAAAAARSLLGRPYDSAFAINNDSFYCSELVYESFRQANGAVPFFPLAPMTFIDPDIGHTFPAWLDYYAKLDAPIPEGEPGINPGGLSCSPRIRIIHAYGNPSGWRGETLPR